jgi:hypothetical protein
MPNNPPVLTPPNAQTCHRGHTYFGGFNVYDPDFDACTFTPIDFPSTAQLLPDGVVSFSPNDATPEGLTLLIVQVSDGQGGTASAAWQVTVEDQPPLFSFGQLPPAKVGVPYKFNFNAFDPQGDQLKWIVKGGPGSFPDPLKPTYQYTPTAAGAITVVVEVQQVNDPNKKQEMQAQYFVQP